ncbi:bifunctional 2-polyprenyl-6-hydroxyphenol methylase/3-demethylubiquinol 3-O-methyltransferase UbiG [Methylosinus sp. RM1]|uniref:class I SAM-dependent methyltransferase n=1 Tax=Methylosinus sp. RM1 TaxID=2583817 RepID=UPI001408811B|nr:class I SAM-dependent methyltransferase [Methylosinus sp. RM1]
MQCPICAADADISSYVKATPILRCRNETCGFRFFDLAKWSSPYDDGDYYAHWRPCDVVVNPWNKARVDMVGRFKSKGRVAELGCGIGETALAFRNAGYDVVAVEESRRAIDFLKGRYPDIDWRESSIFPFLEENRRSFDVLSLFHVLEHIPEPRRVVARLDFSLRDGGVIVIEVPDASGGVARLAGDDWDYYLDHHVNYFDVRSLTKLFGAFGYRRVHLQRTFHFAYPQGHGPKDAVKGALAWLGLNSIVRTVWRK